VEAARSKLTLEGEAFFWLLYYSGVRKSELYERVVDDCQLTETHLIIDFQQRKKGSMKAPPLEFPLWFPGLECVCEQLRSSRNRKPKRKLIERTRDGVRSTERVRARWLFPHVQSRWAQIIVKKVLGSQYYPHFLRLNRITEICSDPDANIARIRSFTGIRTIRVIEGYLGTSRKEQKKAVDFMAKQIKEQQQ
jgi:integrase